MGIINFKFKTPTYYPDDIVTLIVPTKCLSQMKNIFFFLVIFIAVLNKGYF